MKRGKISNDRFFKALSEGRTRNMIFTEYQDWTDRYLSLTEKLIKKYGIAIALKQRNVDDIPSVNYDVVMFCFTKAIKLFKSINAIEKISNYEDAYALLRGSYEAYVYIAYLRGDPNRVLDSVFKIGLEDGVFKHPTSKKGKLIKNKIIDTRNNNIYNYGVGILEKVKQTNYTTDEKIHNILYKFLCEHCHINILSSANYRNSKFRYGVNSHTHNQHDYLIFLKVFVYTNLLREIHYFITLHFEENKKAIEWIEYSNRFLNAILKIISFNDTDGISVNLFFIQRISEKG